MTIQTIDQYKSINFFHNFEYEINELHQYKTQQVKTYDGTRKKIGLSEDPRFSIGYTYTLCKDDAKEFECFIQSSTNDIVLVPIFTIKNKIVNINLNEVEVEDDFIFEINDYIFIDKVYKINNIVGNTLTLNENVNIEKDYCYLTAKAFMTNIRINEYTKEEIEFSIDFSFFYNDYFLYRFNSSLESDLYKTEDDIYIFPHNQIPINKETKNGNIEGNVIVSDINSFSKVFIEKITDKKSKNSDIEIILENKYKNELFKLFSNNVKGSLVNFLYDTDVTLINEKDKEEFFAFTGNIPPRSFDNFGNLVFDLNIENTNKKIIERFIYNYEDYILGEDALLKYNYLAINDYYGNVTLCKINSFVIDGLNTDILLTAYNVLYDNEQDLFDSIKYLNIASLTTFSNDLFNFEQYNSETSKITKGVINEY